MTHNLQSNIDQRAVTMLRLEWASKMLTILKLLLKKCHKISPYKLQNLFLHQAMSSLEVGRSQASLEF